jgi:hypothetical protein
VKASISYISPGASQNGREKREEKERRKTHLVPDQNPHLLNTPPQLVHFETQLLLCNVCLGEFFEEVGAAVLRYSRF